MFNKKGINDERITMTKQKITSEAFAIMLYALLAIVFVKSMIFQIPISEYLTEFLLFIGISFYVVIRMIISGVYAVNLRGNKKRKNRLRIVIIAEIITVLALGAFQYSKNDLNLTFLLYFGAAYFLAFYAILWLSEKLTDRRYKKLLENEEE